MNVVNNRVDTIFDESCYGLAIGFGVVTTHRDGKIMAYRGLGEGYAIVTCVSQASTHQATETCVDSPSPSLVFSCRVRSVTVETLIIETKLFHVCRREIDCGDFIQRCRTRKVNQTYC